MINTKKKREISEMNLTIGSNAVEYLGLSGLVEDRKTVDDVEIEDEPKKDSPYSLSSQYGVDMGRILGSAWDERDCKDCENIASAIWGKSAGAKKTDDKGSEPKSSNASVGGSGGDKEYDTTDNQFLVSILTKSHKGETLTQKEAERLIGISKDLKEKKVKNGELEGLDLTLNNYLKIIQNKGVKIAGGKEGDSPTTVAGGGSFGDALISAYENNFGEIRQAAIDKRGGTTHLSCAAHVCSGIQKAAELSGKDVTFTAAEKVGVVALKGWLDKNGAQNIDKSKVKKGDILISHHNGSVPTHASYVDEVVEDANSNVTGYKVADQHSMNASVVYPASKFSSAHRLHDGMFT